MDRVQALEEIKIQISRLMIEFPKTIVIHRKDKEISIGLVYPYSYEYADYFKEKYFSNYGSTIIKLNDDINNLHYNKSDLRKIKQFLLHRFSKNPLNS